MISNSSNMIIDKSSLYLSLKNENASFEEVNLNGETSRTPVNEHSKSFIDIQFEDVKKDTDEWKRSFVSRQGQFRSYPEQQERQQTFQLSKQRRYGESFSSSTDPSSLNPNTSLEDNNLDEDDLDFHRSFSFSGIPEVSSGERTPTVASCDFSMTQTRSPFLVKTPSLVDELLSEIYARFGDGLASSARNVLDSSQRASASGSQDSDCLTEYSTTSEPGGHVFCHGQVLCNSRGGMNHHQQTYYFSSGSLGRGTTCRSRCKPSRESQVSKKSRLNEKGLSELKQESRHLESQIQYCMSQLTRQVKRRDRLRHRRERQYNLVTAILQASSQKRSQDTRIRFSLEPYPGDPSYNQWKDAMKMVARLPEGVPGEFRKKLWLTLAEKYLTNKGVDWNKAERTCFNEWSNPDDDELGLQIVRDLHRTGCSLFCGEDAHANQLMLKRVLLAYARWNKSIGYCQGFNMLAAIILEVMEKAESDALKVMIFMIEGILPENYFSSNLRGLSVDMAVFRDLMKLRLPRLSKHLDELQSAANDGCSPANYEPPLTNVFTMQWFLTLFSTCLPKDTVLRVWDLILLEGNEVLLRTALAIWKGLEERVLTVKTADEFYCAMGQLSQEMLQFSTVDSNLLIKNLVEIAPFPFVEVSELREKYTFNITPWSLGIGVAKKGLRILYSDDEDEDEDDGLAVAATFGVPNIFKASPKTSPVRPPPKGQKMMMGPSQQNVDKERLSVDISALRQQYKKLRQRQTQAQIILTSAWNKNGILGNEKDVSKPVVNASTAMNHLLLGKKPLVATKPRRPPHPGAIPSPKMKRNGNSKQHELTRRQSATHYACPQPEVVPPAGDGKSKKKRKDDLDSNSSSTEIGENGNETDGGSDIEDLPKDEPILKSSHSTSDFSQTIERNKLESKIQSEPDLLSMKPDEEESQTFFEELLEEFDKNSLSTDDHEDPDECLSSKSNDRALQIIQENSEILERLLNKKGSPCPPPEPLNSMPTLATVQVNKRKVSQTSSNGSSTNSSVKSNITLQSNPATKPITFNPFPNSARATRKPKEVGRKLGLYK